jgi:alkyl hydroperoxide reductase subunit AhpF
MSYFTEQEQQALVERLAGMTGPVRLVFFTQTFGCDTCQTTERIVRGLAEASPLITVEVKNLVLDAEDAAAFGVSLVPAVAIVGDRDRGLRFYGAPEGYEFVSLLDAVLLASAADSQLSDESRTLLAGLSGPRHLQVFSTPT